MSRGSMVNAALIVLFVAIVAGTWAWMSLGPAHGEAEPSRAAAPAKWYCPMHPEVVSNGPGSCPICHMDLVPEEVAAADPAPAVDRAALTVSEDRLRRIGARTATVERAALVEEIRAVGVVAVDETRLREVHTKTAGFVERLYANAVGATVRRGGVLLEIYSPELLTAQEELLVALRARDRLAASSDSEIAASGDAYVRAARRRLELLDMGPTDIAELERTGRSRRTVALASPIGGTVIARNVAQGARVEPGLSLLTVADLSRVWVIAQVYERDLAAVRIGQKALIELAYLPGRLFEGTVDFVYPVLEGGTRTASVRVALPNPDLALKPEMFAEVRLVREHGERLSVARHAVIETGTRRMVFVELSPGSFEPREIETGVQLAERVEVVAGLAEGERVLAEGAFFLDSESRLRAALARSSRTAD